MHHIGKFMWPCLRLDKSKKHILYSKFRLPGAVTVLQQGQVNKFFQYLLRSPELYAITLIKICEMFNDGNFAEGKCEWLNLFPGRFNLAQSVQLNLWGNDEDRFASRLYSAFETSFTSTCPSPRCPSGVK